MEPEEIDIDDLIYKAEIETDVENKHVDIKEEREGRRRGRGMG